ncbi:hypothetical protein [Agromyces allii]|uniref:Uncharacterized protein n=1 Tax=Agromyces allii TaxID=393607 RepID=A0ABP5C1N9_9MICO|nr:hypothetical protein [Agromyces allii]
MHVLSATHDLDTPTVSDLLTGIADRAGAWLTRRRSPDGIGFGLCEGSIVPVELNATTAGVELWVALGLPLTAQERVSWIEHLAAYQLERTGLVVDRTWRGRQLVANPRQRSDGDTFFTMTTTAALDALGGQLRYPVRYLAEASVRDLEAAVSWEWLAHAPFGVGDFGPLVLHNTRLAVPGAAEQWSWVNEMLVRTQDPSGFWPVGTIAGPITPHINRAFHVLRASWNLSGRPIERAESLIDACLIAGDDPTFYGWDTGFACNDLDLAHVAYSAARWTDHRRDELADWARRLLARVLAVEKPGGGFSFFHETAMEAHAGIAMSGRRPKADMWGTLMYLGAIKMTAELGWPEVKAPWAFSKVHAVPEGGRR